MLIETGVVLIAERSGQAVGMAGLVVSPFMFNRGALAAYEVFWWIEPEHRGGIVAWSLLKAVEPACRRRGCSIVQMTALHDSPPQAVEMYRRAGYSHTETSFTKIIGSQ
jgi:GNAT superfamily N-acetyltransferase